MTREEEELVEEAAGAWRPRDPRDGRVRAHPAWLDLGADGRVRAFDEGRRMRRLEAAVDRDGLSATGRAVVERVRRGGGSRER
jgi:hypothetical protein